LRCSLCKIINKGSEFSSSVTSEHFQQCTDTNCKSRDVKYIVCLITYKGCTKLYVGQTTQNVSKRMDSNRYDMCSFTDPAFTTLKGYVY